MPRLSINYYFHLVNQDDVDAYVLADVADVAVFWPMRRPLPLEDIRDTFDSVLVIPRFYDRDLTDFYAAFLAANHRSISHAVSPCLGTSGETAEAYGHVKDACGLGSVMVPYAPRFGKEAIGLFDAISDPVYIDTRGWNGGRLEKGGIPVSREFASLAFQSRVHYGFETDKRRIYSNRARLHSVDGRVGLAPERAWRGSHHGTAAGEPTGSREAERSGRVERIALGVVAFKKACAKSGIEIIGRRMIVDD